MATIYWLGAAVPIPETQTLTFALTWAKADTATVTLNGKSLILTAGTTVTVTQMALDMVAMINGAAANQDETRSALGSSVGEWASVTATSSAGVVTVTGRSDGHPIGTITAACTTAGDGTFERAAGTTATGPGYVDNVANWSTGALPAAAGSDVAVFDHRASSGCKYALTSRAAVALGGVIVTDGYKYQIGLPEVNTYVADKPYDEPLETYFQIGGATVCGVRINAPKAQMIKISSMATDVDYIVEQTGSTTETAPPCLLKINHAGPVVSVRGGSVGINYEPTTTGQLSALYVSGGTVEVGDTTTLATVAKSAGSVICHSAITSLHQAGGTYEQRNGNITTATISGGTFYPMHDDTITTVYLTGGVIDCTKDGRGRTITNFNIYAKSTLKDPMNSIIFTNGIDFHCKPSEVVLDTAPLTAHAFSEIHAGSVEM